MTEEMKKPEEVQEVKAIEAPKTELVTDEALLQGALDSKEEVTETPPVEADAPAEIAGVKKEEEKEAKPKLSDEEIKAKVAAYMGQVSQQSPEALANKFISRITPEMSEADLTAKAQTLIEEGDIIGAIETVGDKIAKKYMTAVVQQDQQVSWSRIRNDANKAVYSKYPELMDVDSAANQLKRQGQVATADSVKAILGRDVPPIAITLADVYKQFPELHQRADGPAKAMEIAEAKLAQKGIYVKKEVKSQEDVKPEVKNTESIQTPSTEVKSAAEEYVRGNQVRAASLVAGANSSGARIVNTPVGNLSDTEKLAASKLGMTEVEYAKSKKNTPLFDANYYSKYRDAHIRPRGGSR
jgi:hypothetical protein